MADKKGFTLIEILIVIAITAVLSGLAIGYSHVGQDQISLSIEESKVAQMILEAKELSIATYSQNNATCAYGVEFDFATSSYSLFEYNSATSTGSGSRSTCPSIASTSAAIDQGAIAKYTSGNWQVPTASGVILVSSTNPIASATIQDILFYPPNPCTLISLVGQTTFQSDCNSGTNNNPPPEAYIYLRTTNGSLSRTITVNPAGQVSL
ncbi:MAG TPA: prepilin-type N-terminal cleavage/methylation domain-containing protein [Candidatus Paceibacterota bacterium]